MNKETAKDGDFWSYQYCTEQFMPFAKSGVKDIYWREPWDEGAARQACVDQWGVEPRALWGEIQVRG